MSKKKPSDKLPFEKSNGAGDSPDSLSVGVDDLYENWFLDYASYVILERAVPRIEDGFKPVQRRIMHALKEMDDGRFNKVANIIGSTMQYHPHGDAAIGEAIVNLGQKNLLIETQGNWGDPQTGDSAAAPRYIEARLSKFALEVVYNPQTTEWQLSYDGRKKEPVTLPVKFPLLLAQGVEGIAVGLSTKILPHNFCELIKASVDILKGKNPKIFPDFPSGGIADFTEYSQGLRGGRIKVRAKVEIGDKKTLIIRQIPYGVNTTSLMESIVKAGEKGQIKIRQVIDNTSKDVEIHVLLQPGQSPEIALDALYAFTDCEVSISPNACVIVADKPHFLSVNDILKYNTGQTVELLKKELEIKRGELKEKILFSSLEKIFIENRIYRDIEEAESWDEVISRIDKGLKPHKKKFHREITEEDIVRLTEIRIKRISRYDSFKAEEMLRDLEKELKQTEHHLKHLTDYAISYYQGLLEKYGKGRERKTEMKSFQSVTAAEVIASNQKLFVNRADGFVGYGLRKDEFICDCSDLDDIVVIRKDGKVLISKIQEKVFMGKDILYAGVWKKGDDRMVYNVIYSDGKSGKTFAKRFSLPGMIRDKEYDLTQGADHSRIWYVSGNPNGEAEIVEVKLTPSSTARKKIFEVDFSELEIKGRGARGITITKYPVRRVDFLKAGGSTLSKLDLWYDEASGRLNKEKRGKYIGKFDGDDKVIAFMRNGAYRITSYELSNRYEPDRTLKLEKFYPEKIITAVYIDGESKQHMIKRFQVETTTTDKEFIFISEGIGSRLLLVSAAESPEVEVELIKGKGKEKVVETINAEDFVDVKGWKAMGNRLSTHKVNKVAWSGEEEEVSIDEDEIAEDSELKKKFESDPDHQSPQSPQSPQSQQNLQSQQRLPNEQSPLNPEAVQSAHDLLNPQEGAIPSRADEGDPLQKKRSPKEEDPHPDKGAKQSDTKPGKSYGVGDTIELDF